MNIDGQVAMVTGAGAEGTGRSIALALARMGRLSGRGRHRSYWWKGNGSPDRGCWGSLRVRAGERSDR